MSSVTSVSTRSGAADVARGRCVAVVVHRSEAEDTVRCVRSLRGSAPGTPVVIVDLASEDGSGSAVGRALADMVDVDVVRAAEDRGIAAGRNLGCARALRWFPDLDHALLVDPRATLDDGAVAALLELAARDEQAAIVSATVVDLGGRPVTEVGARAPCGRAARASEEFEGEAVSGIAMLVDGAVLRDGVRFDERFGDVGAEADLGYVARGLGRTTWTTSRGRARLMRVDALGGAEVESRARAGVLIARAHLGGVARLVALWRVAVVGAFCRPWALRAHLAGVAAGLRAPIDQGSR